MELREEIQTFIDNRIQPFQMVCKKVYDAEQKHIGLRCSLIVNSLNHGSLTEYEYGAIAERSKRGLLLFQKAIGYVKTAIDEYDDLDWISVKCPITFLTKVEPKKVLSEMFKDDLSKLNHLCLEFPIRLLPKITDGIIEKLNSIRSLGVKVMLDDFGDEMCPTMKIASYKFDYVILHSTASMILRSENQSLPMTLLISFLKGLNINVIATDVERDSDITRLNKFGCSGYTFFGKEENLLKEGD